MMSEGYRTVNQAGWDRLARSGCDSSAPYGPYQFTEAPTWLDEHGWLPWDHFRSVLCLAAGGGQQAPLFAYLGYDVTVVDLSAEQLRRDGEVAERHGLRIRRIQGDMLDLSMLGEHTFDLVYQPVSSLYIPDMHRCYRQVARVLRADGLYFAEHWNPVQMQLSTSQHWDGEAYRIAHRPQRGVGMAWIADGQGAETTCHHFIHSMGDLIGGLCSAGFAIIRFAERSAADPQAPGGSGPHLAAYLPTFFAILACRRMPGPPMVGGPAGFGGDSDDR
jgi:SAM-dependent methyltransferase